nr:MAG TPA: hypothetical protein [Caudoviricetes sp.]
MSLFHACLRRVIFPGVLLRSQTEYVFTEQWKLVIIT